MARDRSETPAEAVRRLLGTVLSRPEEIVTLSVADLDMALRVARRVKLLGQLACRLREAGLLDRLPATAVEQLNSALAGADARHRLALWELDRIEWALKEEPSIRILVLKGCSYLLLNLPNSVGRSFVDVDLLVSRNDLDAAEACLIKRHWNSKILSDYDQHYYREWSQEIPPMVHVEREVEIDLHHNIVPPTGRLSLQATRLLESARAIPGSRFYALSPVDIVLHTMTHLMVASDLADALRDLVDIDILLRHFSGRDANFWEDLVDRSGQLDLGRPAFYALRYARQLLGTPVPKETLQAASDNGPPAVIVGIMDRLVPRALYPQHPDSPSRLTELARLLLYMRSHWISMPPVQLARHLTYKFIVRHVRWPARAGNAKIQSDNRPG